MLRVLKEAKAAKGKAKQPDHVNNQGREYYYPANLFNRSQLKGLSVHPDYQKHVGQLGADKDAAPEDRVYVRKHSGHYFIANAKQQHMLRVSMDKNGRIFGCTVYKKCDKNINPEGWEVDHHTTQADAKGTMKEEYVIENLNVTLAKHGWTPSREHKGMFIHRVKGVLSKTSKGWMHDEVPQARGSGWERVRHAGNNDHEMLDYVKGLNEMVHVVNADGTHKIHKDNEEPQRKVLHRVLKQMKKMGVARKERARMVHSYKTVFKPVEQAMRK